MHLSLYFIAYSKQYARECRDANAFSALQISPTLVSVINLVMMVTFSIRFRGRGTGEFQLESDTDTVLVLSSTAIHRIRVRLTLYYMLYFAICIFYKTL